MIILSQKDPRWAKQTIGKTQLTLDRWGCTITCISMLSDYFTSLGGKYRDPAELAKMLEFTQNGLVLWSSLKKAIGAAFEWRQYGFDSKRIDASLKDPKKAVMLEVPLGGGKHWVVALSRIPMTNIYRIADPLTGTKKFSTAYGKITGSAHLSI